MKKALAVICIFVLTVTMNGISVFANGNNTTDKKYNIDFQLFSESDEAVVFNEHRDEIAEYFNDTVCTARKASDDNTLELFNVDDIDFTDDKKISCLKINDSYSDYAHNVKYDEFVSNLDSAYNHWCFYITKGETEYSGMIYPPSYVSPNSIPLSGIEIDGYHIYLMIVHKIQDGEAPSGNSQTTLKVIDGNLQELLTNVQESNENISVVLTDLNYIHSECAVIFVDNKAKYIYYEKITIPYDYLNENTPEALKSLVISFAEDNYDNCYKNSTKVKKLYSYDSIISLFSLCEKHTTA
ncbi:MAG: hypothetical protein E7508_12560 [Ruminococcus sp.]|nr:hypothetical protein [Ruminococcus sp.]